MSSLSIAQGPANKKKLLALVCFIFGISDKIIYKNFLQKYIKKRCIKTELKSMLRMIENYFILDLIIIFLLIKEELR